MDPLLSARVDEAAIARIDPLTRARLSMEQEEAREARRLAAEREERIARAEAEAQIAEMTRRIELVQKGHTSAELAAYEQERDALRRGRINELWEQLERLDPVLASAKRRETQRAAGAAQLDRELGEAQRVTRDPFMHRAVMSWHEREASRASTGRREQIRYHEHALGYPDISR